MEIAAFKVKSCNLSVLTFGHSDLNIWSYKSPIDTAFNQFCNILFPSLLLMAEHGFNIVSFIFIFVSYNSRLV
jgi:hypothetical protein